MNFYPQLVEKTLSPEDLAKLVVEGRVMVENLIHGMSHEEAPVRYGCQKAVIKLSEKNPEIVYPHLSEIWKMLDSINNIFIWSGLIIIGNLASADSKGLITRRLDYLYGFLNKGKMITAGNAANALGNIAIAKSHKAEEIVQELLKSEKYKYDTEECHNIHMGHIVAIFELFYKELGKLPYENRVIKFLTRVTKNTRKATRERAERLLNKL